MDNRIIIIDGNSLINRAYYAMQNPMITREGIYTQGIFGFLNMLTKIKNEYPSGYIAVAFDRKSPTFRHLEYSEYKAGRKKMPPELAMQLPLLKDVLDAMNIKRLEMDGWEADDIIGTIAVKAEAVGLEPLIITGDKDELQLATGRTKVIITKKGISEFEIYDHDAMVSKYGFTPTQFIDFKGLMGDQSDNIPGVPGVGEKTATKLILEYGSVENLIASIDSMPKNKLREKIEDNQQLAVMSKRLATINTNAPVDFNMEEYRLIEPDYDRLIEIYTKLEFNSFLKRLKIPEKKTEINYIQRVVSSAEDISAIKGEITLKVLSDGNHKDTPVIYGIGCLCDNVCYYIDEKNTDLFIEHLNNNDIKLTGHNLKSDIYPLMCRGLDNINAAFDTEIAEYVLDSSKSNYLLKTLAFEYLHREITDEKEIFSKTGQIDMFGSNQGQFADFTVQWCQAVSELKPVLQSHINRENLDKVYYEIELPLIEVLASMEMYGFKIDSSVLTDIGSSITARLEGLRSSIYELAGEEFNINSPAQLGAVLFEKLELPAGKKTQRGYSTSAEVLEKLRDMHPIIDKILEYRMLTKLNGTYVEGLLPLIHRDGRLHAHFQQTVTATGRLSCTEPNLQNIPVKTDFGRQIRKAFVPEEGRFTLVGADYSQIELRVLAHMSQDSALIEAFNEGTDIHSSTAAKVFGIPAEEITLQQRSSAKAINFGVIYGMSSFGLSTELNISRKEAEKYINDYFEKHPKVKEFMDKQIEHCRQTGYVETIEGRKRYIKEINGSAYMVRQMGERLAMNSPIQGSAADIIKIAMIKVYNALKDGNFRSRLILQIHDELIIETYADEEQQIRALLKDNMENAVSLTVKMLADINEGSSWYELK